MRLFWKVPFDLGELKAGEYELVGVAPCPSLECAGQQRLTEYNADGAWLCLVCGTVRDPSEASC